MTAPIRRGSRTRFDRSERLVLFGALGVVVIVAIGLIVLLIATRQGATSQAFDVRPRNFDLWAIYPNGQVRFATLFYTDDAALATQEGANAADTETTTAAGPLLNTEEGLVSLTVISGDKVGSEIKPGPGTDSNLVYPLVTITRKTDGSAYGVDVMTTDSPYLSDAASATGVGTPTPPAGTKILSLGVGEPGSYKQTIVAVALPKGTRSVDLTQGIKPYRQINIGGWTVYYFNTTSSPSSDAIRVTFVPGPDTPDDLDVKEVDRRR